MTGVHAAASELRIDLAKLEDSAGAEADRLVAELESSPVGPIRELARAGLNNARQIDPAIPHLSFAKLHLPPVLLGDGSELHVFGGNQLAKFDLSACFDELYAGESWVERFTEGCV